MFSDRKCELVDVFVQLKEQGKGQVELAGLKSVNC